MEPLLARSGRRGMALRSISAGAYEHSAYLDPYEHNAADIFASNTEFDFDT